MTAADLLDSLETLADAAGGIDHLRELVLHLAVRGRLVPQRPADEPAGALLERLEAGRARMIEEGEINKPRHPIGEPVDVPPFRIPDSWVWLRIGDVGAVVGGGTPKKDASYWADGDDIPWLTPADMRGQDSRYVSRGARDITQTGLRASSAQLLPAGSVLFSSRAPIGHVGIAAQTLTTNQGFKSCVPYVADLTEYIYLYLREAGPSINAAASGTTFKEVSGKEVALVPIPVPPVAEQHRIVARVDELMALLDRLEAAKEARDATRAQLRDAALAALQDANDSEEVKAAWSRIADHMHDLFTDPADISALRQTILHLAARGRLTRQDPEEETAELLLERVAAERARLVREKKTRKPKNLNAVEPGEHPFELPRGWAHARLGDVVNVVRGITFPASAKKRSPASGLIPCLRTSNVQASIEWDDLLYVSRDYVKRPEQYAVEGDIIMSMANSRELVGKVALLDRQVGSVTFGGFLSVIRPIVLSPRFLMVVLRDSSARQRLIDSSTQTTNIANISLGRLNPFVLGVPPLPEQHRITARVDELMGFVDRLEAGISDLRATQEAFCASAVRALPKHGVETSARSAVTVS